MGERCRPSAADPTPMLLDDKATSNRLGCDYHHHLAAAGWQIAKHTAAREERHPILAQPQLIHGQRRIVVSLGGRIVWAKGWE
jgi:hypothetical protein